jgi:hypothetical protein
VAVLWCIAAAEEHHGLLSDVALPMVLTAMADHVEDARVQENCCGFLFSLSSTVRASGLVLCYTGRCAVLCAVRCAVHCTVRCCVVCCVVLRCTVFPVGSCAGGSACAYAWHLLRQLSLTLASCACACRGPTALRSYGPTLWSWSPTPPASTRPPAVRLLLTPPLTPSPSLT